MTVTQKDIISIPVGESRTYGCNFKEAGFSCDRPPAMDERFCFYVIIAFLNALSTVVSRIFA